MKLRKPIKLKKNDAFNNILFLGKKNCKQEEMSSAEAIQSIIEKTRQVTISIDNERDKIAKLLCSRKK